MCPPEIKIVTISLNGVNSKRAGFRVERMLGRKSHEKSLLSNLFSASNFLSKMCAFQTLNVATSCTRTYMVLLARLNFIDDWPT